MKRILLLSLITICFGASSQAQIYYNGRPVRLGFKVEPVFPNTLKPFDNGTVKDGSGIGINYGLMADILFNDARGAFATGLEVQHARSSFFYHRGGQRIVWQRGLRFKTSVFANTSKRKVEIKYD